MSRITSLYHRLNYVGSSLYISVVLTIRRADPSSRLLIIYKQESAQ
jgi:hypothetical protein